MTVRIVTDSAAGLPADIVRELGIMVLDLHVMDSAAKDGSVEHSTAGLSALELAAAYGRAAAQSAGAGGGEDGVLAIHLSRELSSTCAAAVTASGVFDDTVRVVDSNCAGMVQGAAAMAAAKLAQSGASLDECEVAARDIIARGRTWIYIHSTEELRRSGRISAATFMLSAALLATKPIMAIQSGKLELVGKTRTQTKAFTKLVELVQERAEGQACFVAVQHRDAEEAAVQLLDLLRGALADDSTFMLVELSDVVAVHTGPGAIGVSVVFSNVESEQPQPPKQTLFGTRRASES